ncbi:MAG: histidine kinase [Burkholderiales bacterium]
MGPPAAPVSGRPLLALLARGFCFSWPTLLLLAAINTGIAAVLWIGDTRPFWQPLVTTQLYGFSIAYCVNAASPWERPRPILRLIAAVAVGTLIGVTLTILVKGYAWEHVVERANVFGWNVFAGFANGLFVSLFFYLKYRETQAASALHRAAAEHHLLSKQAVEAQLKLMQAQVEPHFLFNTLASVQYLTETDPPAASRLLGHLVDYLRAALPQLRASSTTLGKEIGLAEAYLNILRMRMGPRLAFAIDLPAGLAAHPFPPNLLISLVENAIKHGIEPAAVGGTVSVRARRDGEMLVLDVQDTGSGAAGAARGGLGVGLANVRERLAALYGPRAQFRLAAATPSGTCATLAVPLDADFAEGIAPAPAAPSATPVRALPH